MSRLFFGKFSKQYPDQIKGRYYAAGPEGNSWYGGIEPGDLIFPIYSGMVSELWEMVSYVEGSGPDRRKMGRAKFKSVKIFDNPVPLTYQFIPSRYFHLNLNMVNKSVKSVRNTGFFPIETTDIAPPPHEMVFSDASVRHLYIGYSDSEPVFGFLDGDIRIRVQDAEEASIVEVQEYREGQFARYGLLMNLYEDRNQLDERYSLRELLAWAQEDGAVRKEKYLRAALEDLKENGIFQAISAVALYDNILVS